VQGFVNLQYIYGLLVAVFESGLSGDARHRGRNGRIATEEAEKSMTAALVFQSKEKMPCFFRIFRGRIKGCSI